MRNGILALVPLSDMMLGYVQSVDDAGDVTQDGEQDVDEQVSTAAALEEHTQRWQEDGKDDLADIAVYSALLAAILGETGSRRQKGVPVYLAVKGMIAVWQDDQMMNTVGGLVWWRGVKEGRDLR